MSDLIHVVKKLPEYGSGSFCGKGSEFRNLLDTLNCATNGDEYSSEFDCDSDDFLNAMGLLRAYYLIGRTADVVDMFEDAKADIDEVDLCISKIGLQLNSVINQMQRFYNERDKSVNYIYFSIF